MSPHASRPRAVLFDFFGTLTKAVQRGPGHRQLARMLDVDPDEFAAELDATFYQRARGDYGPPREAIRRVLTALGKRPDDATLALAVAQRVEVARSAAAALRPDAVAVLARLRSQGMRTAVVSDCCDELPTLLPDLPVAPLLDHCVFSVDIGRCKPHPVMYLSACAQLGVPPRHCLYVGDGGSRELSGARCLGMPAVRLAAEDLGSHLVYGAETDWHGPVVRTLTEVLDVVDSSELSLV